MDLFTYLLGKNGKNTQKDLFSYLLGKNAGGSGTYTTFSGTSLNISNTLQAKIKNIALEGNTSQDRKPTPDTPIPIKVVTGEQKINIQNKNLFNKDNFEYINGYRYGNKMYISSTETNKIIYIKCKPNTPYTISSEGEHNTFVIWTYNEEIPEMTTTRMQYSIQQIVSLGSNNEYSLTTNNDAKYLMIWFGEYWKLNLDTLQVELGNVKTEYVSYQSQNYPINLGNIELCKIGNYKDYIYNNNGNWYLHKEIYKYTFDGDENWNNTYGTNLFGISDAFDSTPFIVGYALSNYYRYNSIQSGINNNTVHGEFALQKSGSSYNIYIKNTDINTVEDFKTWLNLHNTIVYFPLVTPIDTQITDTTLITQLENLNNARSYKGTTIIECTSESTDNETIGFSGDIKVTSVSLGNSLNTSLLSSNIQEETNIDDIQEETNIDDVNEIEEQNDEPIENEEIEELIEKEVS